MISICICNVYVMCNVKWALDNVQCRQKIYLSNILHQQNFQNMKKKTKITLKIPLQRGILH